MGRPHEGVVAQIRRSSRAKYHQAIRAAVREENTLVKRRIAECMLNNRDRDFWKDIKKIRGSHKNVPSTIDDCNDGNSIVNLFASSYKHLYSSVVSSIDEMKAIHDHIENDLRSNSSIDNAFVVSMSDVYDAIHGLKSAKKDGENETLTSDYFIHASPSLSVHIAMLISSLFSHGIVVNNMKVSTIKPIPKNISNVCDSSNYRSIAVGSVLGKIVDCILLKRLSDYLITSKLQFGFKPHHSTNMCTLLLKETISYYTRNDSSVYCVLLDATKAFDRISYVKLFRKLIDRKLPAIIVRFLVNLYSEQAMRVQWDSYKSNTFNVLNGVKQGAIFSPTLFCVYIDDLLNRLKNSGVGCYIGNIYAGSMAYADDLTLLAPTAEAMRFMLKVCSDYATEFSIMFNPNKTKCMLFRPTGKPVSVYTRFYINGSLIDYVNEWMHLGNILDVNQSDSACITHRRTRLIGQINDVLCFFSKLDSFTKTKLLYAYCSSFYGSVLWDLQRIEIQRLCSAWRIALRKVWRVPRNTHCNIVAALSYRLPLYDELCNRTINFHYGCLKSKNCVIRNLANYMICDEGAQSPHGRNIRFICSEFTLSFNAFSNINCHKEVTSLFRRNRYDRLYDFDTSRFNVLLEMLMIRDGVVELQSFSNDDVESIINDICTDEY